MPHKDFFQHRFYTEFECLSFLKRLYPDWPHYGKLRKVMKNQKASELKTCKEFDALCADLGKFSESTYQQRQLAKHKERVQKSIAYIAPLIEDKMLSELEKLKKVKQLSSF